MLAACGDLHDARFLYYGSEASMGRVRMDFLAGIPKWNAGETSMQIIYLRRLPPFKKVVRFSHKTINQTLFFNRSASTPTTQLLSQLGEGGQYANRQQYANFYLGTKLKVSY